MIKILKHGTKRKCVCPMCGCEFLYEKEDTKTEKENNFMNMGRDVSREYVNCPQCNNKIITKAVR